MPPDKWSFPVGRICKISANDKPGEKKTCEEYLNRRERRKGGNDHSSEVRRAEPGVMNSQYLSEEK
jgi:hypothetical protein